MEVNVDILLMSYAWFLAFTKADNLKSFSNKIWTIMQNLNG